MHHTETLTENKPHPHHEHPVEVTIDGREVKIDSDIYRITDLKVRLGVPAEYELEIVEDGQFHPLDDGGEITIHGKEKFISHVRCGSSS